jgi:hypothetical protein
MKNVPKTIFSLVLIIVFLVLCIVLMTFASFGIWLRTYKIFTERIPVAEVTISEQKTDEKGQYADVTVTQIKGQSALAAFIDPSGDSDSEKLNSESFKLYGDVIYLGGPIVKFKDSLRLFEFKTIFKVAKLYARYDLDNEKEIARTPEIASSHDLNGGIGGWKNIHDNLSSDNLTGGFYRLFIDTTQLSVPGMYVSNKELHYTVYMTNSGFLWELDK